MTHQVEFHLLNFKKIYAKPQQLLISFLISFFDIEVQLTILPIRRSHSF